MQIWREVWKEGSLTETPSQSNGVIGASKRDWELPNFQSNSGRVEIMKESNHIHKRAVQKPIVGIDGYEMAIDRKKGTSESVRPRSIRTIGYGQQNWFYVMAGRSAMISKLSRSPSLRCCKRGRPRRCIDARSRRAESVQAMNNEIGLRRRILFPVQTADTVPVGLSQWVTLM